MDWDNIFSIVMAILVAMGLPLALRSWKKGGQNKVEELQQHFQGIGVRAATPEDDASQEETGQKRPRGEKSLGVIKLTDKNIDSINVIGVASQYGTNYFLDYLVESPTLAWKEKRKKTKMVRKRSAALWGKVVDIEWQGDDSLARKLNFDYRLRDKLLQIDRKALKGGISIFPEPENGHVRIRTGYSLPTPDVFTAVGIVARHVNSGW